RLPCEGSLNARRHFPIADDAVGGVDPRGRGCLASRDDDLAGPRRRAMNAEPTCANCRRGILKENGRVACGAGFEEGAIWAEGYKGQIAPILALAMFAGADLKVPDYPRADDMK